MKTKNATGANLASQDLTGIPSWFISSLQATQLHHADRSSSDYARVGLETNSLGAFGSRHQNGEATMGHQVFR